MVYYKLKYQYYAIFYIDFITNVLFFLKNFNYYNKSQPIL